MSQAAGRASAPGSTFHVHSVNEDVEVHTGCNAGGGGGLGPCSRANENDEVALA